MEPSISGPRRSPWPRRGRGLGLGLALALALAAPAASAQQVAPGRPLFRIRTGRFDLYYPEELAAEADRLAGMADAAYEKLAARFPDGSRPERRIPILLSDRCASPNGAFSPYPSDRILLFAAPAGLGSELGSFDDDLRAVFTHELAHALSLRTRGPLWALVAAIAGDAAEPCLWMAPSSIVEGAAVASEGEPLTAGGGGRAVDPLALSLVKQDLLEGRGKDFWQASGAWDAYPFGRLPYLYGGLFSARLIAQRGEERYAELWRRLGKGNVLAGVEGGLLFKGAFEEAYGEGLDAAWEEFLESAALREPVVMATRRLAARPGYITALAAGSSGLYWADAAQGAILALEDGGGEGPRRLCAADGSVNRLDLSPDGSLLLVSAERRPRSGAEESFAALVDAATGRRVRTIAGLREAAFAGDAVVGIASEGFRSDLVLERGGERRVLLAGGPGRSYGSPASLDGATIYCLARDSGRVLVLRVDAASGRAFALSPGLPLDHIRSLSLSRAEDGGARLALSFAAEGSLYRLALVEDPPRIAPPGPGGPEAAMSRQETLLSGSVLQPAAAGGSIYYIGRFSAGEYPCAYPSGNPALALRRAGASWAALDPSFAAPDRGIPAPPNARERAPALPLALRTFRFPSLTAEGDSAGLVILGADIAERLAWSVDARYDWEAEAADLSLRLGLGLEPWSAAISLSDGFRAKPSGERRSSEASLELSRSWSSFPSRRKLSLALSATAAAAAPVQAGSAYESPYDYAAAAARAVLAFSDYRRGYSPPFPRLGGGADLSLDAEWPLSPEASARPAFSAEAGLDGGLAFLGMAGSLRAAWSPDASVAFGPADRALRGGDSVLAARAGSYSEYGSLPARGSFYAFAAASISPVDIELQRRLAAGPLLSSLYLNRLTLEAGLRGAAYGAGAEGLGAAELLSSAYGRLALTGSPLVGKASSVRAQLGVELSWAFRGDLVASQSRLAFLAGLSL